MVIRHYSEVAAGRRCRSSSSSIRRPRASATRPETLARLAEIPQVAAVKDWSNEIVAFERNLRALRATGRPVAMLSSFTMSLMATFLLGADGAISGHGQRHRRSAGRAVRGVRQGRPRRRPADQRPARSAGARLLRAPVRGHAQPDEGSARPARPHPGRPRAAAAHAGVGRPSARPSARRWSRPACSGARTSRCWQSTRWRRTACRALRPGSAR